VLLAFEVWESARSARWARHQKLGGVSYREDRAAGSGCTGFLTPAGVAQDVPAGASAADTAKPVDKAAKTAPDAKAKDTLDDLFDSASIKGRSGARKDAQPAASETATASGCTSRAWRLFSSMPCRGRHLTPCTRAGPDMEQVKKEASKFLSGSSGQRAVVDGLKVYSEKELEEEMGIKRPAPFLLSCRFSHSVSVSLGANRALSRCTFPAVS